MLDCLPIVYAGLGHETANDSLTLQQNIITATIVYRDLGRAVHCPSDLLANQHQPRAVTAVLCQVAAVDVGQT